MEGLGCAHVTRSKRKEDIVIRGLADASAVLPCILRPSIPAPLRGRVRDLEWDGGCGMARMGAGVGRRRPWQKYANELPGVRAVPRFLGTLPVPLVLLLLLGLPFAYATSAALAYVPICVFNSMKYERNGGH